MSKTRLGPDGIHIFNRDSGANLLLTEVIPPKSHWTDCPRQVSIALTNLCDLECTHCYAPKEPARLEMEIVKEWLLELDAAGCFGIGFGGGEPTLYKGIEHLCEFAHKKTRLAVTLTTHGHRIDERLLSSLKTSVNFLRISMDGVYEVYEQIRGRSFASLLSKLNLISGQIPFGINYVVNSATIGGLPDAVEIAKRFQAAELLLLPEVSFGRGQAIGQETSDKLVEWIKTYTGDVSLSISSHYQDLVSSQNPLRFETEEKAYAHIDATGRLKHTSFDFFGQEIDKQGVLSAYRILNNMRN